MKIRRLYQWVLLVGIGIYGASCQKTGISDTIPVSHPSPDTTRDVKSILAANTFTLFKMAAQRAGLDSLLPGAGFFTIFAPVDTAMASAGLDAAHISAMSVDMLRQIVLYHVVQGAYNGTSLTAALSNIQANTLRQDVTYNILQASTYVYQQLLYIKKTGAIYVNGEAVNDPTDTALSASNGYIWPVHTVLQAPQQTIWGLLQSRPELSLYLASLRMIDSIYHSIGWLQYPNPTATTDSAVFDAMYYTNQQQHTYGTALPAVFAPTDSAFAAAGFHSTVDLLSYATQTMAGYIVIDQYGTQAQVFSPLDSVLKQHFIINGNYIFSNLSLYNDFLFNPNINNGGFNANQYTPGYNQQLSTLLQFSNAGNTVHIQWGPTAPAAVLPAVKSAHFMTTNGVVYEINQLFYPHN
jgi:uncharacterized surface protein with fasciclin (FAS1) repeats